MGEVIPMEKYNPIRMYITACMQTRHPSQTVADIQRHGADGDYDLILFDGSRVNVWPTMGLVILEDLTRVEVGNE